MGWISFIYSAFVLATSVPILWHGEISLGLSGLVAPLVAQVAGGGMLDGYLDRSSPTLGVVVLGLAFIGASIYWVHSTGFAVGISGLHISGEVWCLIGVAVGVLFRIGYRPGRSEA